MEEGEIEEWAAVEGSPRLVLMASWVRTHGTLVMRLEVD